MGGRLAGICRDRLADQLDGGGMLTALVRNDAEQMKRIEVGWRKRQRAPIKALGFGEAPLLVARDALLEQ